MSKSTVKSKAIRRFVIENVTDHRLDIVRLVVEGFSISRQAVNRHLRKLIDEGLIIAEGKTRNRIYNLVPLIKILRTIPITSDLEEDKVWREQFKSKLVDIPAIFSIPKNVLDICQYGFTEMLNNVISHSNSKKVFMSVEYNPIRIEINIGDYGIGIFKKIKNDLGLNDEHHAILELSKGKLTTDPERHSGEGIFFTSRIFDKFSILSGKLFFSHTEPDSDWLSDTYRKSSIGTFVTMIINAHSKRTINAVISKYALQVDRLDFSRTHVPVALVRYGNENLVSRSQARRLLAHFDRFKEVLLDFKGVDTIGQAFADEIFRVFNQQNPNIKLVYINENKEIWKMINRVTHENEQKQLSFDTLLKK